jgi:steroid 5-alpha reductase family enzyme
MPAENLLNQFAWLLGAAVVFSFVLMLIVWRIGLRINNLGIVDIAWSFGFLPLAILFGALAPGDPTRRLLAAGMAGLWSLFQVIIPPRTYGMENCARTGGPNCRKKLFGFFSSKRPFSRLCPLFSWCPV